MVKQTEVLLIEAARKGDERAWRLLFELHFKAIYGFCLHLADNRQDLAEDITQQVFIIAAKNIGRFKPQRAAFRTWLIGITKKIYLKHSLKENKVKWYEAIFALRKSEIKREDPPQLLVYEVLAVLPAAYRQVLEDKYLNGLTVSRIAESRRSTDKAIESLLARARDKFAEVYIRMRE